MALREVNEKIILLIKRRFSYLSDINRVLDEVNEELDRICRETELKYCVSFWRTMMILGRAHMCDHYNWMKSYKTSITKGFMKYQNHVVSAIEPAIYQIPYIEKNAIKIQQHAEEK